MLQTIDDTDQLTSWLDSVRTDPATRHLGLSYRAVIALLDIRQQTLSLFPDRDGVLPVVGPLYVERCTHPAIYAHAYLRYVAYYGGMPHHYQIPLYFAQQLYAEFVLGFVVDYHDRRPGAGHRVGRLQDQRRRPGDIALRAPPSQRARREPMFVPLSSVQSVGMEFAAEIHSTSSSIRHLLQTFGPSSSQTVHVMAYGFNMVVHSYPCE